MVHPRLRPVVQRVRAGLRTGAARRPWLRRAMTITVQEFVAALDDGRYDGSYFGQDRNPLDRMGLSGYERYDRDTSNADIAAYLVWRFFDARRSLDVGCAMGFVVEALRELGVDAGGVDVSQYAVDHAAAGARGHVRQGNLLGRLPFDRGSFDVVTALETLEHLPPDAVPRAVGELRRVTRGWVLATIPSFGPNAHGPGGWLDVKARPERLDHYRSLCPGYDGPIPYEDIYRDAAGEPIEGHLTLASFTWWTKTFEAAGFERCGELEREIHPHLARFGLTKYWNLYVFRVPGVALPEEPVRTPAETAEVEARWHLDKREADPEDLAAVEAGLAGTWTPPNLDGGWTTPA
jgi:SAM-dependent methyltransferase